MKKHLAVMVLAALASGCALKATVAGSMFKKDAEQAVNVGADARSVARDLLRAGMSTAQVEDQIRKRGANSDQASVIVALALADLRKEVETKGTLN